MRQGIPSKPALTISGALIDIRCPKAKPAEHMRILVISAEGPPLQRTGALIDVMNALPRELRERGHEVSVVVPHYREIPENTAFVQEETGITLDIRVGEKTYVAEFVEGHSDTGV